MRTKDSQGSRAGWSKGSQEEGSGGKEDIVKEMVLLKEVKIQKPRP